MIIKARGLARDFRARRHLIHLTADTPPSPHTRTRPLDLLFLFRSRRSAVVISRCEIIPRVLTRLRPMMGMALELALELYTSCLFKISSTRRVACRSRGRYPPRMHAEASGIGLTMVVSSWCVPMAPCTIPLNVPLELSNHLSTSAASTLRRQSVGNVHVMSMELDALQFPDTPTMTYLLIHRTPAVMLSSGTSTTTSGVRSTIRTQLAGRSPYSSSRRRHFPRRARVYPREVLRTRLRRVWLSRLHKCRRYCACNMRFRRARRL